MATKGTYGTGEASEGVKHPAINVPQNGLVKTQLSFSEDLMNFAEGTVPQSLIVALVIGALEHCQFTTRYFSSSRLILLLFSRLIRGRMWSSCQYLLQNSLCSNKTNLA